jgi:hypothetical protein
LGASFTRLAVGTGRYEAEWFINRRTIQGAIDLESARPPQLTFFGEAKPLVWKTKGQTRSAGFPQRHDLPEVVGKLRTGHEVVVTDAVVSVWAPERSLGAGRFAVVGLGIAKAARTYPRVRLQVTGSDLLFGIPPIESTQFPDPAKFRFGGTFGATLNRASVQRWEDSQSKLVITCSYEVSFSLTNRFRHQLVFAPVVELKGEAATLDEWMTRWIRPLLGLAALATKGPQRLSWLTVHAGSEEGKRAGPSGVVFGSGIWQAPYEAEESEKGRDPDWRPLLTLRDIPIGLPAVLVAWRDLERSKNPFLELYRSVLFQHDLLPRARFLYLIQALEGLHSYENRKADEDAQARFGVRRQKIIDDMNSAGVASKVVRFIRDNWSKRRSDSLDRRLRDLIEALPAEAQKRLEHRGLPLSTELQADGERRLDQKLRRLRNELSHGTRRIEEEKLEPWVDLLETIAQFHLLRRLGIDHLKRP